MGAIESCRETWSKMTREERKELLMKLWWGDMSPRLLAAIDDYDNLPPQLRGKLIMAYTENGFSVTEYTRTEELIQKM